MILNDEEHGTLIHVDGIEWIGVIGLGAGAWLAYKVSDPSHAICMVVEDEE